MKPMNVQQYEAQAQARIEPGAWAFYSSGADDEVTLRANRAAFERVQLLPRMLRGVRKADLGTTVLGTPVSMPVLVAPTALQGLACPEGECATAQAAGNLGTLMVASTETTRSLEEIAAATTGPLWFQLYLYRGRRLAEPLVRRAEAAGFRAIVLTVDLPRLGHRERSPYPGWSLPPATRGNFPTDMRAEDEEDEALSWEDIAWLRSLTDLPILLKGILRPDDAALAVEHGAAGIIVSNHGGRQLDGVPASIEALPAIVEAVEGRVEVYMDGGVRRGTDVLKALALGARAVLVGRPILWGLGVDGAAGAQHVLELLRDELELAMVLAGVPDIASIDRSLIKQV
ncbi:MAG TPA: alpha-hydroxy acid oxidase [Ktedonobacterales bacterium]|nr:alpha-hydroxy acid oxidase [Ktedonobacterales bacterium]